MSKQSPSSLRLMLCHAGNILLSRLSGLGRDITAAAYWGAVELSQAAYNTAFAIPNIFRCLFAEGAFSAAFVPIVSKKLKAGDSEAAWRLTCRCLTAEGVLLLGIIALFWIASPIVLALLPDSPEYALTQRVFQLLPLLIPYAFFICISGVLAAFLNALGSSLSSSLPVIFNILQMAAVALLCVFGMTRREYSSLIWFSISVLVSGILQLALLLRTCRRRGFVFRPDFNWKDDDVRMLVKNMGPGIVGSGANIINVFIDKGLAVYLGAAAVGAIAYSNRLIFLPIGVFGVAMNIVCLNQMSRASQDELAGCLDNALRKILALALPCTAMLAALDTDIIRLLFMRGAFDEVAVRESAWALAFYLPGLPAYCLAKVATTTHHGRLDTKTPMRISLICIGTNFVLNVILIQFLRQGGLALASSITAWMNVIMLLAIDTRKIPGWRYGQTIAAALKLAAASAAGGVVAFYTARLVSSAASSMPTTLRELIVVAAAGLAGIAGYLAACRLVRQNEIMDFVAAARRRKK